MSMNESGGIDAPLRELEAFGKGEFIAVKAAA